MGFRADSLLRLAFEAHAQGDIDLSRRLYLQVLKTEPDCVLALGWLGSLEAAEHNLIEAERLLKAALSFEPHNPAFLMNFGNLLQQQGLHLDAIRVYERCSGLTGSSSALLTNLASCHNALGLFEKGRSYAEEAVRTDPFNPSAWSNLGAACYELADLEIAHQCYQRALDLEPKAELTIINLGMVLKDLQRTDEAFQCFREALRLNPSCSMAWARQAQLLVELDRFHEALIHFDRAAELAPEDAEVWNSLGALMLRLGRCNDAMTAFERARSLNARSAEAHYNMALVHLRRREFSPGFEKYCWRWQARNFPSVPLPTSIPRASRATFGGSILLWGEQGIGDEIFYSGLLPNVTSRYQSVALVADRRLHPVLTRSFSALEVLHRDGLRAEISGRQFDYQAPIGDLGYLLQLDEEQIALSRAPYFSIDLDRSSRIKKSFEFSEGKPVCGLSWLSKNPNFGDKKSIQLADLAELLRDTNAAFVSLQYGDISAEIDEVRQRFNFNVHQFTEIDSFNDIDGLLSLVGACDFVLTVSNVTSHLAGSIGKSGCVLVPFSEGRMWFWHENATRSLWYPSLELFYQDHMDDWSRALEAACLSIAEKSVPVRR